MMGFLLLLQSNPPRLFNIQIIFSLSFLFNIEDLYHSLLNRFFKIPLLETQKILAKCFFVLKKGQVVTKASIGKLAHHVIARKHDEANSC